MAKDQQRFTIVVVGTSPDRDQTIRGIRQLVKRLGRDYKLKCEIITTNPKPESSRR